MAAQRRTGAAAAQALDELERGGEAFARRRWTDAFEAFSLADEATALGADDLCLLAWSAHLIGRHHDFLRAMERAHHLHLEADHVLPAARSAFWLGFVLGSRGEIGPATGWFARSARLVERNDDDCVEQGYLLLPSMLQQALSADWQSLHATAIEAAAIGERFKEADLTAFALHWQGRALVRLRRVDEGLRLLDEAMVAVTTGKVSPTVTGQIYCSMIEACQEIWDLRRSQEWTIALSQWCDGQPDLVPYTGQCLVHRAELMALHGAWQDALDETDRAIERAQGADSTVAAAALYRQGEIHRLLGDFATAEQAYRAASQAGWEPQPGLALLRLAQGESSAATAAVRRVLAHSVDPLERARMLPAAVEILLAGGLADEASEACRELEQTAAGYASTVLGAMAAGARGAVELARGDAAAAVVALRRAAREWQQINASYELARLRLLVGLACRALGDHDAATFEFDAARHVFEQVGAAPDLSRLDSLVESPTPSDSHRLTRRELQVLQLITAGKTNKAIANELSVSEKTVERHVSNVLMKLGVSSRAAATAYAYEHQLIRPA
jgi:DNA-binding NarL/FixJ family response regulator